MIETISVKNFVASSNSDFFPKLSEVNFQDFVWFYDRTSIFHLAGEEQRHYIHNTFNVLTNEGFLRDQQGIETLEVVQKFYEITKLEPRKAKKVEIDILALCPKGRYILPIQAVITCVQIYSSTNEAYYHAVKVSQQTIDCDFNPLNP